MKVCTKCDRWLCESQFYRFTKPGKTKDMLHTSCKECQREAARQWSKRKHAGHALPRQPRDFLGRFYAREAAR